jgi:mannosyltransferase
LERAARRQRQTIITLSLLVLLAFTLRVYRLGHQSFWYDEGQSYYFAHQDSLGAMLGVISDSDHPPLYFILLYLWMSVAGRSEFALRFTALFWSLLLVPLVYLLGRRAFGIGEGITAALLMAVSPFHVWYAQEARMYTLATFLGLLSSYLLLLALQKGRRSLWLAYTLAALAAPYAHLYACFVLLLQGLFVLLWAWRSRPGVPFLRAWLLSQVGIGLGFLPWVSIVLREYASNATYWPGILDLERFLLDTVVAFSAGLTLPLEQAGWTAMAFLLALGVGCASLASQRSEPGPRWQGFSLVLLYLMVPTLAALVISYRHPKYAPRYLLLATPAYYLLAAKGLAALRAHRRWAGLAVLLLTVILVGAAQSLYNGYFVEEYARDDFRAVLGYIEANAWEDDAVIIVGGHAYPILDYYNHLGLAAYPIPPRLVASVEQPVDRQLVVETLNEIVVHHRRVWLILWQERLADPARLVLNELVVNTPRLGVGAEFHGPALLLFSLEDKPHFSVEPAVQHPVVVDFADNMQLVGYELTQGQWLRDRQQRDFAATQTETEELVFEPGETIYLALYWRTRGAEGDYTAFTHLLAQDGTLYGSWDRKLGGEFYPSSQWPTSDTLREEYPLVVSPEAPPGRYQIEAGLYLPATMERLPVLDEKGQPVENRVLLCEVQVE